MPPEQPLSHLIGSRLLPYVEQPMRYVGNEQGIIRKDLSRVTLRGVLCFPDLYDIGMSHHGSQILYHLVNRNDSWALSRCYHPWYDAERIMRDRRIPLFDLEYTLPLSETDWLGFTIQYELQYTNVLNMLDLAGIPLRGEERTDADPIVIAGGPCMGNSEPLADHVDAVAVGDGEATIEPICEVLQGWAGVRRDRGSCLERLSGIRGVYVPSMTPARRSGLFVVPGPESESTVRAARVDSLKAEYYPDKPLVPLINVVHHRLAVEVMRGCTRGCRFCSAGTYYRPVRERPPADLTRQIESSLAATGWDEIGLLSLSTADYSGLPELLRSGRQLKNDAHVGISLPSTRVDALDEEELELVRDVSGGASFTIAPEAGSPRLRGVINKDFTDRQILDTVQRLLRRNVRTLKLYFMIGLPSETDEDIDALVALVERIAGSARGRSRGIKVNVAISPFSPRPHTPFQWEPMGSVETLTRRSREIKSRLARSRNVRVSWRDPRITLLETLLARGDRRVGEVLQGAWRMGARMDGWDEFFDLSRWERAAGECGVDLSRYIGEIPLEQQLPWRRIDVGVSRRFLVAERDKARRAETTPDCRDGPCALCGACEPGKKRRHRAPRRTPREPIAPASSADHGRGPVRTSEVHCRFTYRKGEALRFLGHRDMVRVIERAFITAGIRPVYTQGFHKRPRLAFGPPLPLGAMGERELFDIVLRERAGDRWKRVNEKLPEGLQLLDIRCMSGKPKAVSATMRAARWRLEPLGPLDENRLKRAVSTVLARREIRVERKKKSGSTYRDIRNGIGELHVTFHDGRACIEARLAASQRFTVRPADLLAALFPDRAPETFLIARVECLSEEDLH